jgi:coenzyme F420-0:L-glutamate ligase/coenzyme F420-1:gamma-L-glutamate ligase
MEVKFLISVIGLMGIPEVHEGDDIAGLISNATKKQGITLENGDIIVVTHKIVSKSEGRIININQVVPSAFSKQISKSSKKDPRYIEIVLNETKRIVKMIGRHLITETKQGLVCANAGIDRSNVSQEENVALLPKDPDISALNMREKIKELTGSEVVVIISDTFGRPWRKGQINIAIGVSGMIPLKDYRGKKDSFGNKLSVSNIAIADEIASAAELVMNKVDGIPVAIIKGYNYPKGEGDSKDLIRSSRRDLFA